LLSQGQYLIADSAYGLSPTVIPAYKAPASNEPANKEFNYCLANSQVRNKHSIGVLKSWWASLQGLRLHLNKKSNMMEIIHWINCCITLHNMLAKLGNSWAEQYHESVDNDAENSPNDNDEIDIDGNRRQGEILRAEVHLQQKALNFHYAAGTLRM
jgi:hypothetical protein